MIYFSNSPCDLFSSQVYLWRFHSRFRTIFFWYHQFSSCEKLEKIHIFQNCSSCNNQVHFPFKTISVVLCVADTLNVYRGLMRNRYPKSTLTEVFWVNTKVSPVRAKWVTIKIKGKLSGRRSLERGGKIASLLPCYWGSKEARSCKS